MNGDGRTRSPMNDRERLCYDDGVRDERNRMIALLEEHRAWLVQHNHEGDNFIKAFAFQDAIALIKGEK